MRSETSKYRSYLHDLTPEQARRLELVQAGLPIPKSLEAKKNPGNKSYPQLPDPGPQRLLKSRDPRKMHKEDPKLSSMTECGLFWRNVTGQEALRHTTEWDEVTCRKCMTYQAESWAAYPE